MLNLPGFKNLAGLKPEIIFLDIYSGLPKETVFLCFQIRSLDPSRFPAKPAGKLSGEILAEIENKVRYCLGL